MLSYIKFKNFFKFTFFLNKGQTYWLSLQVRQYPLKGTRGSAKWPRNPGISDLSRTCSECFSTFVLKGQTHSHFHQIFSSSGWVDMPFDSTLHLVWADCPHMITGRLRVTLRILRFDFIAFSWTCTDGVCLLIHL